MRWLLSRCLLLLLICAPGCQLLTGGESPLEPTTAAPPQGREPVRYTALGASDALGVGSAIPCFPLTDCPDGTSYTAIVARTLRSTREVRFVNIGIPAGVLSPRIEAMGRKHGRDIPGNFLDRSVPSVLRDTTLVTVFTGSNDANFVGDAAQKGEGGNDVRGFLDAQVASFGAEYDQMVSGIRQRAPGAFIVVLTNPNLAGLPYSASYSSDQRRGLQKLSVGFAAAAARQMVPGLIVVDLMCDPEMYRRANYDTDGFHPNDGLYAHIARKILTALETGSSSAPASCPQMTIEPPL
jgi:lysophospholipase L1-like esterase